MDRQSFVAVAILMSLVGFGLLVACSKEKNTGSQPPPVKTQSATLTTQTGGELPMELTSKMPLTLTPVQSFDVGASAEAVETDSQGNIYYLSPSDHSVAVYDRQMRLIRRIGKPGQAPGELHAPNDMAISQSDTVYIADTANRRVQMFKSDGQFIGGFSLDYMPWAIAVNSRNEIFINGNQPKETKVEVYSADGKLIRAFGEPNRINLQGLTDESLPEDYISRVINSHSVGILATDPDTDDIYFAFESSPILRKYDRLGHLLFEIEITGGRMKEKEIPNSIQRLKEKIKQRQTGYRQVMSDLAVDPQTGKVWVVPMNHLFVYDGEGKKLAELNIVDAQGKKAVPQYIALQGERFVGLRFPTTLHIFLKPL